MTAIAGAWRFFDKAASADRCLAMLAAQARYGTGPSQCWAAGGIALGRRLTPVVPEDRYDRGVEQGPDGAFRMVADVRIDNRAELARALGIAPAEAGGLADARLLMLAWQRWREAALERVVGDFAVAVWDGARLILARDFPGQRPLCYWQGADQMAFASMPHGLFALDEVVPQADMLSIERFARFAQPVDDGTYFHGIRTVAPGETIAFTPESTKRARHWAPPRKPLMLPRDEDYVEAVRETLDLAVGARLRGSEGGLACHLSAGLDSSAVMATAARLHTAARPISAITVTPSGDYRSAGGDRLTDERELAAATASQHESVEHLIVERANRSPLDHFDTWFDLFQRPASDVPNQDWYTAANEAAQCRGATMLLHGQAGNLTFSHSGPELLAELLAQGRLFRWARESRAKVAAGIPWRSALTQSLAPFLPRPLWIVGEAWRGRYTRMHDYALVRPGSASCGPFGSRRAGEVDYSLQPRADARRWRAETLGSIDYGTINKGLLAAWGLDLRDPLADRRMIELTLAIPATQFDSGGVARSLARRVLADRVPDEVLSAPRRGYQSADWLRYLSAYRHDIAAEAERQRHSGAASFLDHERIRDLLSNWPTGWNDPDALRLHRGALMTALAAGHFARRLG